MKKRFILIVALLILFPIRSWAHTFWTATAISDGSQHCFDSPSPPPSANQYSKTIAQGIACMVSGDTLKIRAGTYAENITTAQLVGKSGSGFSQLPNAPALPNWGSAQIGNPTTIQTYQNEAIQTGSISIGPSFEDIEYIVFRAETPRSWRVECNGTANDCIYLGGSGTGVLRYIKIDGVDAGNIHNSGAGIVVMGGDAQVGDHLWLTNSYIHHSTGCNLDPTVLHDAHGVYMETPDNLIELTEITDVGGYGIHNFNQTPATRPNNNVYRQNYIHDVSYSQITQIGVDPPSCQQTAFAIGTGNVSTTGTQVYKNLIVHNVNGIGAGIGAIVYNNTIFNNGTGTRKCSTNVDTNCDIPWWCCSPAIQTDITQGGFIRNNILFQNAANAIADQNNTPITGSNISNNFGLTGQNPLFVNSAVPNCTSTDCTGFHLQTASPAIDFGTAVICGSGITGCPLTLTGFQGAAPDAGYFEITVSQNPPQIVFYYHFDESKGTTVTDFSGNGFTGTLSGGVSFVAGSKYGPSALEFDGISGTVTVQHSNLMDFTSSFSLSAWGFPEVVSSLFTTLISRYDAGNNSGPFLYATVQGFCTPGGGGTGGGFNVNNLDAVACDTNALPLNQWTYLTLTYDNTIAPPQLKLYKGTTLVASATVSTTLTPSTSSLLFGSSFFGEFFKGRIDEPIGFNFALPVTSGTNVCVLQANGQIDPIKSAAPSITRNMNCGTAPSPPVVVTNLKISANSTAMKWSPNVSVMKWAGGGP